MHLLRKSAGIVISATLMGMTIVGSASAHVVVKPAEALTGAYQMFTVSAPNEKDVAFTSVKVLIPDSVQSVMPSQKAGWTITEEKTGQGETAKVSSITWTGNVDPGLRDDFSFSTKLPDNPTELSWKAYQTYADGTTVAWDQKQSPASDSGSATSGPLSVTKVVASVSADSTAANDTDVARSAKNTAQLALYVALAGLLTSLVLLVKVFKK